MVMMCPRGPFVLSMGVGTVVGMGMDLEPMPMKVAAERCVWDCLTGHPKQATLGR